MHALPPEIDLSSVHDNELSYYCEQKRTRKVKELLTANDLYFPHSIGSGLCTAIFPTPRCKDSKLSRLALPPQPFQWKFSSLNQLVASRSYLSLHLQTLSSHTPFDTIAFAIPGANFLIKSFKLV